MPEHRRGCVDAVFFIPFAERELGAVVDAVDSIERYVSEPHHIYAVDDCSPSQLDVALKAARPQVTVLRNGRNLGPRSGLFLTMETVFRRAMSEFQFKVFVKMDSDALMTGPGLVSAATRYCAVHPEAGVLGSFRVRADGHRRRWTKWRLALWYESTRVRRLFGAPVLWRPELERARRHGYRPGEHALGGAYIVSAACVEAISVLAGADTDLEAVRRHSRIAEDVICSLLCRAAGYEVHDFGMPQQLMALGLDRVPIPKEEVIRQRKAIVHSVRRGCEGETEEALRAFFRTQRRQSGDAPARASAALVP